MVVTVGRNSHLTMLSCTSCFAITLRPRHVTLRSSFFEISYHAPVYISLNDRQHDKKIPNGC